MAGPRGMPMPMYPNGGPPIFYPPTPGQPGFVYPQMVLASRGRFPGPYGQGMPPGNYVVVQPGSRGGMQVKNNGRGMVMQGGPRRGGMKQPGGQPGSVPVVPTSPSVIPAHVAKD